ncbi:hypothetical protein GA0061099_102012 [Bradyrhizobium yuanmingense]|uniref:Uncharacterized protein n=1 Tax=Bradyrhizobium yuanmingense TaxID=108015 RepID=A0A1C3XHZ9_9BRAD|nr:MULTISPECIES: hypothetical protein [Bradyrhizobium]MCA1544683.1 hypothetical protein [Bradyrhizobium sp. NBAIM32]TWI18295.1 hypothetical protein IQ15_07184 [Bradyrhizobium yuanmingense]SCB51594.1 hypothetical protein GA0061099_102012 [Bradyrhizobium yuanmingense]
MHTTLGMMSIWLLINALIVVLMMPSTSLPGDANQENLACGGKQHRRVPVLPLKIEKSWRCLTGCPPTGCDVRLATNGGNGTWPCSPRTAETCDSLASTQLAVSGA